MRATERHAYVCYKCDPPTRKFEVARLKTPPSCPHHTAHGRMELQRNRPYMHKKDR